VVPDGGLRDTLRYEIWAIDLRRKRVVKNIAREASLVLDRTEAAAKAGEIFRYQVQTALALDPGRYQLRASATSARAGKSGSVYLETDVVDYAKTPIAIGPIALAYADGPRVSLVRGGLPSPVLMTLDRDFEPGERLRALCEIARKDPATVSVDLYTASGDRARRLMEKSLGLTGSHMLEVEVDLAGLTAGGYRLRLTASDGAHTSQRELPFVVR